MNKLLQIRPALPTDAERAAVLLYSAYTHTPVSFPLAEIPENQFIDRLQSIFREKGNRFSYQNIQVALQQSNVVGLILSFGGRDEEKLNATVGPWLEREAMDDEWYIDAVAVFQNQMRQGIGTRLLQIAEQQAYEHHYNKIALNVAQDNKPAFDLYQHLNYVVTQKLLLYQRPYIRMVKTLSGSEN